VGGPGHEAPDLTDTIILASINLNTGQLSLLSIPRDIWVPSLRAKINTSYHYGEQRRPGSGGLLLAKSSVSEITGLPIHYAAVLNFSSFVELVDLMGGIDVNNQTAFTDDRYPLPGKETDDCGKADPEYLCRYESISFPIGSQHLDGVSALKFVRSRHAADDEGTDYARSRRQSEVIKSVQTKLLALAKNPSNFTLLQQLYTKAASSLITDFPLHQTTTLFRLGWQVRQHPPITEALSENNALYHPPVSPTYDNQWVLIPKGNNSKEIFDFVSNFIN
jgi:anionic cell wall polymer biosynthesis LytR-Cps2A-Psr (LCP) family protein